MGIKAQTHSSNKTTNTKQNITQKHHRVPNDCPLINTEIPSERAQITAKIVVNIHPRMR